MVEPPWVDRGCPVRSNSFDVIPGAAPVPCGVGHLGVTRDACRYHERVSVNRQGLNRVSTAGMTDPGAGANRTHPFKCLRYYFLQDCFIPKTLCLQFILFYRILKCPDQVKLNNLYGWV